MILLPLGDQRITMRRQRRVELRRVHVRKFDPPTAELLTGGLGDQGLRLRPRIGFGSRFQADRGAQLVDRGDPRQLRVMLIRSLTRPRRDDADLIQRQATLPHALRAARKLLKAARDTVLQSKRIVQVGTQHRSEPYQLAVRDIIRAGRIGEIVHIEQEWNINMERWRWVNSDTGSGPSGERAMYNATPAERQQMRASMSEREEDRIGLLLQLASLNPHPESVPINMLVRVEGTPLGKMPALDPLEMVRAIATARILMPASRVRLAAGRKQLSQEAVTLCFLAGANSIFVGEKLLTTPNPGRDEDEELLQTLGMKPLEPHAV